MQSYLSELQITLNISMPHFLARSGNSRMQSILITGFVINLVIISLCLIYGRNARGRAQSLFFRPSCSASKEFSRLSYVMWKNPRNLCRNPPANPAYSNESHLCHLSDTLDDELLKVVHEGSEHVALHGIQQDVAKMFVFSESDFESDTIRLWHTWEPELVAWTLQFARKLEDVTFLDIGSSLGVYSFQAARLGIPVVALDANIRRLLRLQLTLNAESLDATLVWNFLADDNSARRVNFSAGCAGVATSGQLKVLPVMPLRSQEIASLIRAKNVVMKIDIDGAEVDFLLLSGWLFSDFNVPLVQMEWNPSIIRTGQSQAIFYFFTNRGYRGLKVPGFETFNMTEFSKWSFIDIIWIRKDYLHIADKVHT